MWRDQMHKSAMLTRLRYRSTGLEQVSLSRRMLAARPPLSVCECKSQCLERCRSRCYVTCFPIPIWFTYVFIYIYIGYRIQAYVISAHRYVWTRWRWYAKILRAALMQQTSKRIQRISEASRLPQPVFLFLFSFLFNTLVYNVHHHHGTLWWVFPLE